MASNKYLNTKSSAKSYKRTGNASGLADFRVWKVGYDSKELSEHMKTTFKVAYLNVGSLKRRCSEVVQTMCKRSVFEVQRLSDKIVVLRLVLGEYVFTFVLVYAFR